MGGCATKQKDATTLAIEEQLKADKKKMQSEIKILLLGTGESGKSTIAKQFRIINTGNFSVEELKEYKRFIYENVTSNIKALLKATETFELSLLPENQVVGETVKKFEGVNNYNAQVGKDISTLWNDPAIQAAFKRGSEFPLNDNCGYLMEHIERISGADYTPTQQDVVNCRVKTVGVIETEFELGKRRVRMVDVGGQRSERRKWMGCFDGVTAVMFCIALSEYDLKLREDGATNRMKESFKTFEELANKWFPETTIIIFLNKSDLFLEKIQRVPLTVCFPEYSGKNELQAGCNFIRTKLLALDKNDPERLYPHVTNATDTVQFKFVFDVIKDTLLKANLTDLGF